MAQKMTNAPVYFVIVQVRFNQVLALDSYVPAIQEYMRKEGYPDFEKSIRATFNLKVEGTIEAGAGQVPLAQTARYTFANMDKTSCFLLDQGALSYQTTEYDVFETSSAAFLKALALVSKTVGGLSYSERIGVRYLDAVYPQANESLGDYVNPSVLGLVDRVEGELVHSFSETVTKSKAIGVTARTIIEKGEVGYPPDLVPMTLQLPERFRSLSGLHATLDTDGWSNLREPFDLRNLNDKFVLIHDAIEKTFKATVTAHALKVWS